MIRFNCDYGEGAHPRILARLQETNLVQTPGYGEDEYCREAADIIRSLCEMDALDVHFLMGGTQANLTVLSAALRPWAGRRFHRRWPYRRTRDGFHRGLRSQGALHPPRKRQAAR